MSVPHNDNKSWQDDISYLLGEYLDALEAFSLRDGIDEDIVNARQAILSRVAQELQQARKEEREKIKNDLNELPHRCYECGKVSGNMKLGDMYFANALRGRCVECTSKMNNLSCEPPLPHYPH